MIDLHRVKYLITGTGHCGTVWASEVLRACGLTAVHEGIFQTSIQDHDEWTNEFEAEVSCKAAPYLSEIGDGVVVAHLVRNPLDVVRSMYYTPAEHGWAHASKEWVQGELGKELPTSDPLSFIVAFVVEWTDLIDRSGRVEHTIRLEDGDENLAKTLGLTLRRAIEPTGNRARAGAPKMTWGDIPDGQYKRRLLGKSIKYGYGTGGWLQHGCHCLACTWNREDSPYDMGVYPRYGNYRQGDK